MSEPILTVLKFFLLALVWLFFLRVLRVQWVDIRTRQVATPLAPGSVPARPPRGPRAPVATAPAASAAAPTTDAPVARAAPGPSTGSGRAPASGPPAGSGHFVLRAVDGPDHPARAFPVSDELTVGRSGSADIALGGDSFVSSRHARIWAEAGALWVEDLGSTNGTTVNGNSISTRTRLSPGDRVQIGRTVLEVGVG